MTSAARNEVLRVLLVGADLRTARRLAQLLEEDGFAVDVAEGGAQAVARLEKGAAFDVLITELHMPKVNGPAVAASARTRRPTLPVIYITEHPELAPREQGASTLVFTKPVSYAELNAALGRLVHP